MCEKLPHLYEQKHLPDKAARDVSFLECKTAAAIPSRAQSTIAVRIATSWGPFCESQHKPIGTAPEYHSHCVLPGGVDVCMSTEHQFRPRQHADDDD
jgi:hypothetical protein